MENPSFAEVKQLLRAEFGDTLEGPRDEGLDRMADALERHGRHDRSAAEAALAEMVEQGLLRYVTDPVGGVGAGIVGTLTDPNPANIGMMTGGRPLKGAMPASQEHGSGHWDLTAES